MAHNLFRANPLLHAMFEKDVDKVKSLIQSGTNLLQNKVNGLTPFEVATRGQQRDAKESEIAALVVAYSLTLTPESLTLQQAAQVAHLASIRYYIKRAPRCKETARDYTEAMFLAVDNEHTEVVALLIDAGVSPEERSLQMHGQPLLTVAAGMGHVEITKLLLERRADVNATYSVYNDKNLTAAMVAARSGRLATLKLLVEAGADLSLKDESGKSALTYAKESNYKRIVTYLESIYEKDKLYSNLSLCEAARDGILGRVQELLEQGVFVDEPNDNGETPLMLAAHRGNEAVVELLCARGANINATTTTGTNLWHYALTSERLEVVRCLLQRGLDANLVLSNGMSPLIKAAEFCAPPILQELLQAGANVGAIYTPQALAEIKKLREGKTRFAQKISKYYQPYTALEYAKRCSNKKAYEYLKDYTGAKGDAYDQASTQMKAIAKLADASFNAEAQRIGDILHAKPQPWTKRKGVVHFIASLGKALTAYYQPASNVRNIFSKTIADDEIVLFRKLQSEVREKGYGLVYAELDFQGKSLTRLLLFPISDPMVMLAACSTNAANHGMGTREIVNWCAETQEKTAFFLLGAGFDFIDIDFQLPVEDRAALINRIANFCPEILSGEKGELDDLANQLRTSGRFFCWWD